MGFGPQQGWPLCGASLWQQGVQLFGIFASKRVNKRVFLVQLHLQKHRVLLQKDGGFCGGCMDVWGHRRGLMLWLLSYCSGEDSPGFRQ